MCRQGCGAGRCHVVGPRGRGSSRVPRTMGGPMGNQTPLCPSGGWWEGQPEDLELDWLKGKQPRNRMRQLLRPRKETTGMHLATGGAGQGWQLSAKSNVRQKDKIPNVAGGRSPFSFWFHPNMSSLESVCFVLEGWDHQSWGDHQLNGDRKKTPQNPNPTFLLWC